MMKAAVFKDKFQVETVDKPVPHVTSSNQVVVKVKYSGLCGSDLHYYRGHIPSKEGTTMGHEFVGTIVEKSDDIEDSQLSVGDDVISVFTIQCGDCWYCGHGYSGTCNKTNTFGKIGLDGGQAEYVLVPYAKATLVRKPESHSDQNDSLYVLMADIFVTGYFGSKKILDHFSQVDPRELTVLQIGAGPVGLCAVNILKHFGFKHIVVVDGIQERLDHAKRLGASDVVNFVKDDGKLGELVQKYTDNMGFDAVLEIVGAKLAIRSAFDSVRRGGFIACVGMGHDELPFNALEAYAKGITISFGRCNAWLLFPEALNVFEKLKHNLVDLIHSTPSIDDAAEYYRKFEKGEVGKVVFRF